MVQAHYPDFLAHLAARDRRAAWVRLDAEGGVALAGCDYPLADSGETPCWPPQVWPAPRR